MPQAGTAAAAGGAALGDGGAVVALLPRMMLPLVAVGVSYEAFCPPLHLVQQGDVPLGTVHPGKRAMFDDGPHLCLVQIQETICIK